jgi:ribosomal protein S12 methylthiotransferase accessory factor YcaO
VIAIDLTRPDFAIPVVRLVIPGLEWDPQHPNYQPGPRARQIAGA